MVLQFKILILLFTTALTLNLPGVPLEFTEDNEVISAVSDNVAYKFSREYIEFLKTGRESATLKQISTLLAKLHNKKEIFNTSISELSNTNQFFICTTCRATVRVIDETFRSEDGELNGPNINDYIKKIFLELCERFDIQTSEICAGLVDLNWPILHYITINSIIDAQTLCGTLPIKFCKVKQDIFDWTINIDNQRGPLTEAKSAVPKKTNNDLTVVHLTDIHFDPEYRPGSLADCEEPLCCRKMPDKEISKERKAGYWSDYRDCDAPFYMLENTFDHIKATHKKIDFIYQTGDIMPHNVWSTTKEGNKAMLTQFNDLMMQKFPDIPIYPCVGNHEPHPANLFGHENIPPELNVSWLYEHLWTLWQHWLPIEAKSTILRGGYYTVSPKPGFRIISLNNNDCYIYNWWIYLDGNATSQPQLDWLQETLLAAEKASEYVHILAHIPPGESDCWSVWAREYNRIIERYSHIIGGTFGGHTHKDEMNLHYSQNAYAMGIYWNGGSLTPYSYKNPNYRIYEVEPKTYQVVDHHTWIFNITEANEYGQYRSPRWFKEYQFTNFTQDLSPAGIDALFERMAKEPELLRQYWKYKMTSSDPKLAAGCDKNCLVKTICSLVKTISNEDSRCNELKTKLYKSLATETTTELPDGAPYVMASVKTVTALLFIIYNLS